MNKGSGRSFSNVASGANQQKFRNHALATGVCRCPTANPFLVGLKQCNELNLYSLTCTGVTKVYNIRHSTLYHSLLYIK